MSPAWCESMRGLRMGVKEREKPRLKERFLVNVFTIFVEKRFANK